MKKENKEKSPSRGVLIMAMGNPNWGKLAVNLAMSLRFTSPDIKITLAQAGSGAAQIGEFGKTLFDKIIPIDQKYYTKLQRGGENPIITTEYLKAKLAMYKLSPYDETIFLDADMVWCPKRPITDLFNELNKVDFAIANRSFTSLDKEGLGDDFGVWASPKKVKKLFKFKEGKYYNLSSEMVYFKKTKEVGKLFSDALKIYDRTDLHKAGLKMFNGAIPDELPLTIAMIKNDLYPHKDSYLPIYWESAEHKHLEGGALFGSFWAYSMGGAFTENRMKKIYNNLVQYYCNQYSQRHPFKYIDKRSWMPGRHNL